MSNPFFDHPILNSPYDYPLRHWELDSSGQPTQRIIETRRRAEFCRVVESHPKVSACVKNHNLGLEVPYRYCSEMQRYLTDFIVHIDDGHGSDDPLHLVVEIKGYRREDAKESRSTMETCWIPAVNNLGTFGRWAFAELIQPCTFEIDMASQIEEAVKTMLEQASSVKSEGATSHA